MHGFVFAIVRDTNSHRRDTGYDVIQHRCSTNPKTALHVLQNPEAILRVERVVQPLCCGRLRRHTDKTGRERAAISHAIAKNPNFPGGAFPGTEGAGAEDTGYGCKASRAWPESLPPLSRVHTDSFSHGMED